MDKTGSKGGKERKKHCNPANEGGALGQNPRAEGFLGWNELGLVSGPRTVDSLGERPGEQVGG